MELLQTPPATPRSKPALNLPPLMARRDENAMHLELNMPTNRPLFSANSIMCDTSKLSDGMAKQCCFSSKLMPRKNASSSSLSLLHLLAPVSTGDLFPQTQGASLETTKLKNTGLLFEMRKTGRETGREKEETPKVATALDASSKEIALPRHRISKRVGRDGSYRAYEARKQPRLDMPTKDLFIPDLP